jgi:hypothetical protein
VESLCFPSSKQTLEKNVGIIGMLTFGCLKEGWWSSFFVNRKLLLNEAYRENSGNEYFMLAVGHLSLAEYILFLRLLNLRLVLYLCCTVL